MTKVGLGGVGLLEIEVHQSHVTSKAHSFLDKDLRVQIACALPNTPYTSLAMPLYYLIANSHENM